MLFRYATIEPTQHTYNSTGTCAEVDESARQDEPAHLALHCPTHVSGASVISEVLFASYGTPTGTGCDGVGGGSFAIDTACHATDSARVVAAACVGQNQCVLEASNSAFGGDPCHKRQKRLAVLVSCQKPDVTAAAMSAAPAPPPAALDVAAWVVRYPWHEEECRFESSDGTLNAVWRLSRDSLRITSLDTATDSNTRERLPYEADGYITGLSRLALQAEYAWPRAPPSIERRQRVPRALHLHSDPRSN
eukprot:3463833-Prymnesium_polylepis.1